MKPEKYVASKIDRGDAWKSVSKRVASATEKYIDELRLSVSIGVDLSNAGRLRKIQRKFIEESFAIKLDGVFSGRPFVMLCVLPIQALDDDIGIEFCTDQVLEALTKRLREIVDSARDTMEELASSRPKGRARRAR